jgi:hypothetical protein
LVGNLGGSQNLIVGISVRLIAVRFLKTGKANLSEEESDARACSVCPQVAPRIEATKEVGGYCGWAEPRRVRCG